MSVAAAKLPHKPDDWVPISVVVELTDMHASSWTRRAVALADSGLAMKMPPPSGTGKPTWWFHRSIHANLGYLAREKAEQKTITALSGQHPAHLVERATRRLRWVKAFQSACDAAPRGTSKRTVAERIVDEARATEGDGLLVSVRSLQRWTAQYNQGGVDALIDKYRQDAASANRSPEAIEYFYTLYHTEQRISVRMCHDHVVREAEAKGWRWPPSCDSTYKWLLAHDELATTQLMRQGVSAYQHNNMAYMEQDYSTIAPGQLYVCDHHQLKEFVFHNGKPIRPWLTAIMDARTRICVGWHLGPSPHTDSILIAIRQAFTKWGVPDVVRIDNGKDFTSKTLVGVTKKQARRLKRQLGPNWRNLVRSEGAKTGIDPSSWFGILPELGCRIVTSIPYQAWSKLIERWFRTLTDQHVRTRPGFCDTSAERKPEGLKTIIERGDLPTLEEEALAIGQYIDIYHNRAHTGDGMNGRSPLEVWKAIHSVARIADEDQLNLLCAVRGTYKVGANGVHLQIGTARCGYGQYSAALNAFRGRKVLVSVDPANIDEAVILTPDRRVICKVGRNKRHSPVSVTTAQEMRDAQAVSNRSHKAKHAADRSAPNRMLNASQILERDRNRQAAALRATGTCDARPAAGPDANLKMLQTNVEGASIARRTASEAPAETRGFDMADLVGGDETTPDDAGSRMSFAELAGGLDVGEQDTEVLDPSCPRATADGGGIAIEDLI